MIDSDYVLWIQLVMLRQRSPSILSIQKFVGEPKLEFRMVFQIADCAKTELFCATSQHHERVGIVEPELFGHADAGFAELVRDLLERARQSRHRHDRTARVQQYLRARDVAKSRRKARSSHSQRFEKPSGTQVWAHPRIFGSTR